MYTKDERRAGPRPFASVIRRVIVTIIVVSFGVAAVSGIVVLLGGELGDAAFRVLSTTGIVGMFSVAVLCCAALIGRRTQLFGYVGAAISIAAAALSVWMVWNDFPWYDAIFKVLWTLNAATGVCALAALLLLLSDHARRAVRFGLTLTLVLVAVGFALIMVALWGDTLEWVQSDGYWRLQGIVWILAALGGIVVPVTSLILRDRSGIRASGDPAQAQVAELSAQTVARILAEAEQAGLSPDAYVRSLLPPEASETPR